MQKLIIDRNFYNFCQLINWNKNYKYSYQLIDLGNYHGIDENYELIVIKKGKIMLDHNKISPAKSSLIPNNQSTITNQ